MIVTGYYLDHQGNNKEITKVFNVDKDTLDKLLKSFTNSHNFWRIHYKEFNKDYYWDKSFGEFTEKQLSEFRKNFNKSLTR